MNLNHKKIIPITTIAAIVLLAIIWFLKFSKPDGNLEVVSLVLDERTIQFSHTDENKDETLIIKTDSEIYEGEDSADIYVSITNTTKKPEKSVVLFYFPKTPEGESGPQLETLEQRNRNDWELLTLFKSNIKINEELLKNALKKRELIPDGQEIKGGSQIEIPAGQTAYLKLKISFPVGSTGEFWVEAIGQNGGYGLLDPMFVSKGGTKIGKTTTSTDTTPGWYSASGNNWSYRKKITIDKNKVSGTSNHSNFPLLVSRTDLDFKHTSFGGNVASSSAGTTGGGGDFVFTSSDGTTKLDHEIEKYASSSGELISWVEVPTLSVSADTILYVYYGGPSSGATNQNVTGVWDANYKGVWHMKENPAVSNCSTFEVCDSTSNTQNGDSNGSMTAGDQVNSKIGFGLDFDGSNDYISIGDLSAITPPYTVSLWFNTASISSGENDMLFGNAADFATAPKFKISNNQAPNNNGLQSDLGAKFRVAHTSFRRESNIWRYATWVIPGTDATAWPIYLNGTEEAYDNIDNTGTQTEFGTNNGIGGGDDYAGFAYWNGKIDEVRISNSVRSAAWIKTEYNNQFKPSTFAGFGGQQKSNP